MKRYCVRIVEATPQSWTDEQPMPLRYLLLFEHMRLAYRHLLPDTMCFDLLAPVDLPDDLTKGWADGIMARAVSLGINAVTAPEWVMEERNEQPPDSH